MADYSGTPLQTKLGIGEGATVALLDAPRDLLSDLPASVVVKRRAAGRAEVVVAFFTSSVKLERRIDRLGAMIFPSGALWVAWPKRTSGQTSDLTDNVVREVALPRGLVDNKVCSVDETWSALRLVWRRELRSSVVLRCSTAEDTAGPATPAGCGP